MRKLILILMLVVSSQVFCQADTYVRTYKGYITEIGDIKNPYQESRAVAIFHPGGRNEVLVTVNEAVVRYFQISNPEKAKDEKGNSYQLVECIKENTGKIVQLHIYPETLRIYIENDYVEFLNY